MFADWKQAWREAVANFQRELDHDGGDEGTRAMRRDERTTSDALRRLDSELGTARSNAAAERESESVCRRRGDFAHDIGDEETARIALEYAERHAERALILERKVEVLEAERGLLVRDLERMRTALAARVGDPQVAAGAAPRPAAAEAVRTEQERDDHNFRKMEREARERAADARLEELKRKLRQPP